MKESKIIGLLSMANSLKPCNVF